MRLKDIFKFRDDSNPEQVKPFLEHLEDLRWTLLKMGTVLALAMIFCFGFRVQLMRVLLWPLDSVGHDYTLQWLGPADSIYTSFKLAFYAGIVLAFPFLLYFVAQFILPGLTQVEKRYIYPAVAVGFGLFLTGVLFCYFVVLPLALAFFARDAELMGLKAQWEGTKYLAMVTQFTFAFGLTFELPVVVMFLVKIGVLSHRMLNRTRSYATVAILTIAAILTPTTDVLTLFLMAGPMLVLYEICIWLAFFSELKQRKREKAEEAERASHPAPPPAPEGSLTPATPAPAYAQSASSSSSEDPYGYGYDSGYEDHWGQPSPDPEESQPAPQTRHAVHPARKAAWGGPSSARGSGDWRRRGGWKTGKW